MGMGLRLERHTPVQLKSEYPLGSLPLWLLSWIHTRKQAFFYPFVACAFPFFEVKSVLPIDRYQNATSKAILLHEFEKSPTSRAIHACDTGFYWSSENALHERFIARIGVGVWMKCYKKKNASVQVWIQLHTIRDCKMHKKVLLSLTKFVPHLTILYGCDFDNDGHCHWDQSRIAKLFW